MTGLYKDKAWSDGPCSPLRSWPIRKSLLSSPGLILATFTALYLFALFLLSHTSYRDPTSYFFDSHRAYEKIYSLKRVEEAEAFIYTANGGAPRHKSSLDIPLLCIGVATVGRRGDQYVSFTVGSLLEGLSEEERSNVFLDLLIGHTEPAQHPVFAQKWVETLPDRVLEYRNDTDMIELVRDWEEAGQYRNKSIYDYTYLLRDCYETGAEYIAMIEDDTLAVAGWYGRAMDAVQAVETAMRGRSSSDKWVYLRLFYSDDLLGWNSEEWRSYLFWSFAFWIVSTSILIGLRRRYRKHLDVVSHSAIAIISCLCIPAAILLWFLAGKQTVLPISPGIHEMNKYGCCSQGFIFPKSIVPRLLAKTDLQTDWLVDMMIEQIADREGWVRWALVPPLLQHIGATSSKGYGFDDSARRLWNFRFEQYP
jgi:N-Acetylglucosaminyltransferase-IV (GnT-IV) conserved region